MATVTRFLCFLYSSNLLTEPVCLNDLRKFSSLLHEEMMVGAIISFIMYNCRVSVVKGDGDGGGEEKEGREGGRWGKWWDEGERRGRGKEGEGQW